MYKVQLFWQSDCKKCIHYAEIHAKSTVTLLAPVDIIGMIAEGLVLLGAIIMTYSAPRELSKLGIVSS